MTKTSDYIMKRVHNNIAVDNIEAGETVRWSIGPTGPSLRLIAGEKVEYCSIVEVNSADGKFYKRR